MIKINIIQSMRLYFVGKRKLLDFEHISYNYQYENSNSNLTHMDIDA